MRSNVACDHRSGAHKATPAESNAAHDRCIRSDGHALFDPCFHRNPVAGTASRSEVVSKNRVWSKEDVVADVHVLPNTNPILDRYVIAESYSILDESVIADITVSADADVHLDMSKRPDASAFANRICFDQSLLVDKCSCHIRVSPRLDYGLELGHHAFLEVHLLGGEARGVGVVRDEHDGLVQLAIQG